MERPRNTPLCSGLRSATLGPCVAGGDIYFQWFFGTTAIARVNTQRALAVPGAVPTGSLRGPREVRVSIVPISRVGD